MAKRPVRTRGNVATSPRPLLAALDAAEPRPLPTSKQSEKKNYAERLSRQIATVVANALRADFPGITPAPDGSQQEAPARTSKGVKKLDVNYSTSELGLGLGISVKTVNFRDKKSNRYTKNYTRVDNELRAEAMDYHARQPYAVLAALILIPADAATDTRGAAPSSFGSAVQLFRNRANRMKTSNEEQLFELVYVGLYDHEMPDRGDVVFFDVMRAPPKHGRPKPDAVLSFDDTIRAIIRTYDLRNNPPFTWADDV